MVNHLNRFVNNSATLLSPLHRLLKKNQRWTWSTKEQQSFNAIKRALSSTEVLFHYDPRKLVIMRCDASPYGVGPVLLHRLPSGEEKPIIFASRTMSQAEKTYSQLDKEALAIMFGVKRFYMYVFGRHRCDQFVIVLPVEGVHNKGSVRTDDHEGNRSRGR